MGRQYWIFSRHARLHETEYHSSQAPTLTPAPVSQHSNRTYIHCRNPNDNCNWKRKHFQNECCLSIATCIYSKWTNDFKETKLQTRTHAHAAQGMLHLHLQNILASFAIQHANCPVWYAIEGRANINVLPFPSAEKDDDGIVRQFELKFLKIQSNQLTH